jgi:hypothetical protein
MSRVLRSSAILSRPAHRRSEPVIVLGSERATGKVYAVRHEAFRRGLHILGSIGAGKTSLLLRYLYATGTRFPFVVHDFIGNGHRQLETWIANLATMRRRGTPVSRPRRERRALPLPLRLPHDRRPEPGGALRSSPPAHASGWKPRDSA